MLFVHGNQKMSVFAFRRKHFYNKIAFCKKQITKKIAFRKKQINILSDDIESPRGNKLPLWMVGLMY